MKNVLASSPARVSLFGEYSKLVGESIVISLRDIRLNCKIYPSRENFYLFNSKNLGQIKAVRSLGRLRGDWTDYLNAAICVIQKKYDIVVPRLRIEIDSDIPIAGGLASSSSLVVGVIKGICLVLGIKLSDLEIAALAFSAEFSILHVPCGQMDQYACSLGGTLYINNSHVPPKILKRYQLPDDIIIVVGDPGVRKSTKHIISKVTQSYKNGDLGVMRHFRIERELIRRARSILADGEMQVVELGKLINVAHESYNSNLHASSRLFNDLCAIALDNGAYGAKISGGGFGGCMFALADTKVAPRIKKALAKKCKAVLVSKV